MASSGEGRGNGTNLQEEMSLGDHLGKRTGECSDRHAGYYIQQL